MEPIGLQIVRIPYSRVCLCRTKEKPKIEKIRKPLQESANHFIEHQVCLRECTLSALMLIARFNYSDNLFNNKDNPVGNESQVIQSQIVVIFLLTG